MTLRPFIILLCLLASLPVNSIQAHEKTQEQAFYAVCSLQIYLDELLAEKEIGVKALAFTENEVTHLWQKAAKGPYVAEIKDIHKLYDKAIDGQLKAKKNRLQKVALALADIWQKSNAFISERSVVAKDERHFFLPKDHFLASALDPLFLKYEPLKNKARFLRAGFDIICKRSSTMIVAAHENIKGYVIKAYLNSDNNQNRTSRWAINRCLGAENIRNLIQQKQLKCFSVPDKWIYVLPGDTALNDQNNAVLVATHVNVASKEETKWAWKNIITKQHLNELFCILSHGFSSTYLVGNIPYTKEGIFSCLDTEYPHRKLPLKKVSSYLNEEMRAYWKYLLKKGGPI